MPPLSMVQLGCFVAVAETGSFADAGRRLGMTTSGVSKAVAKLEREKALRLLNRSTHAVSLTPEGEHLLPLARDAIRGIEDLDAAMGIAAAGGAGGRVRLGAPTAFLNACLAPLLPRLHDALPDVTLDLRGSDVMVDLADEAMDLVLRTGPLKGIPGHRSRVLFAFPWIACASPAYLARRGRPRTPADLADHDLVAFRNQRTGMVDPWQFTPPRAAEGGEGGMIRFPPAPRIVLDDANAIAAAAVAGAGIAWVPRWLVSGAVRAEALVPLLADWAGGEMTMSLVRREGPVPDRVERVMAFLKAHRSSFA